MQREGIAPLPMVTLLIAGLLWLPATGVPLMLWRLSPPFIDSTYGGGHQPFELLGMSLSLLALGMAGWWVIRSKPSESDMVFGGTTPNLEDAPNGPSSSA